MPHKSHSGSCDFAYRPGVPGDALCLGVLATQVFLDTYATSGINADLAHEAQTIYSSDALLARLQDKNTEITVVERNGYVIGFLEVALDSHCPTPGIAGLEVLRLYVQAPFQRQGIGQALLARAEARARELGKRSVWLTAWAGNAGALAFYTSAGYEDVGATQYVIQGISYENRVFARPLAPKRKE
jgi:diamine N-acetyltransferase